MIGVMKDLFPSTGNIKMIVVDRSLVLLNTLWLPRSKDFLPSFSCTDGHASRQSAPLAAQGDGKRTHQLMRNLVFESTKDDFIEFKAAVGSTCPAALTRLATLRRYVDTPQSWVVPEFWHIHDE